MNYQIDYAEMAKLYVVIDKSDFCRPVAAFASRVEAQQWIAARDPGAALVGF